MNIPTGFTQFATLLDTTPPVTADDKKVYRWNDTNGVLDPAGLYIDGSDNVSIGAVGSADQLGVWSGEDTATTPTLTVNSHSVIVGALAASGDVILTVRDRVGTKVLDVNAATMIVNTDPSVKVGIGLSSPSFPLHVNLENDNNYVLAIQNTEATVGRNYGVRIQAGSSSADTALSIINEPGITTLFTVKGNGFVAIGKATPNTKFDLGSGAMEFAEMTAPAVGAVNTARLFTQDDGGGKTQLAVRFNTGAIQVIATEP